MSGAGFGADVEGVGPTVVLKQMYYRHRLDLSCAPDHLALLPSLLLSLNYSRLGFFKTQRYIQFLCIATPKTVRTMFVSDVCVCLSLSIFSHPLFHFPQCCFCFFLAVHTNICFVRVTSHIPNHRESRSQRQQTGADPEIQPRLARIKCG